MSIIKKEEFAEIITELRNADDYQRKLNIFFSSHGVEGYIYQPDCSCAAIKLLHLLFEEKDKGEWISYFCFDLDFGRVYKNELKDKSGNVIPFSKPEDLYDFLTNEEY